MILDSSGIMMHTNIQNCRNNAACNVECEMYDVREFKCWIQLNLALLRIVSPFSDSFLPGGILAALA